MEAVVDLSPVEQEIKNAVSKVKFKEGVQFFEDMISKNTDYFSYEYSRSSSLEIANILNLETSNLLKLKHKIGITRIKTIISTLKSLLLDKLNEIPDNLRNPEIILVESTRINENMKRIWGFDYNNKYKLFISHKHTIQRECSEFSDKLNRLGIKCFVAHVDATPTMQWQDEIEFALRTSDGLFAILSDDFYHSEWTDQEVGAAIGRDIDTFSMQYGSVAKGFIGKFQSIPYHHLVNDYEKIVSKMTEKGLISDAVISTLEKSVDYNLINEIYEIFRERAYISDEMAKLLVDAFNKNKYVSHSTKFSGGGSNRRPGKQGLVNLLLKKNGNDYSNQIQIPK